MNLQESIRRILKEETLDEGGMVDSLKKFFGKKEKTPDDRLVDMIVKLIKERYTIDQAIDDDGDIKYYLRYEGIRIMMYYPTYKRLEYTWKFVEEIYDWISDDRLLEPDSEIMGKVFEKLYKKKVNSTEVAHYLS